MREIKFRAWDIKNKKMEIVWNLNWVSNSKAEGVIPGSVSHVHTKSDFKGSSKLSSPERDSYYGSVSTSYALMQFTGLIDKNGKEIYEGDIVIEDTFYGDFTQIVRWSEDNSGFWLGSSFHLNFGTAKECEVVGNIYENPELLEKE